MFTKLYRGISAVSLVSLLTALLAVAPVAAAATTTGTTTSTPQAAMPMPGIDRNTAGGPLAGPITLAPKAVQWYKFTYHYDINDKDHDPTNVVVELKMNVPGCVAFEVQTRNRLDFPFDKDGKYIGPIGNGTPEVAHNPNDDNANDDGNIVFPSRLLWVGSQRASEHFYVIVKNKTTDSTCNYTLSISGPDVSF